MNDESTHRQAKAAAEKMDATFRKAREQADEFFGDTLISSAGRTVVDAPYNEAEVRYALRCNWDLADYRQAIREGFRSMPYGEWNDLCDECNERFGTDY